MKRFSAFSAILLLTLAGCGSKDEGNSSAPPANVGAAASVAAPAGKQWSDIIEETPEGGFRMGNADAALKIVEFGSLTCPHCRDFAAESANDVRAMVNTGKLSFEFRHFVRDPLDLSLGLLARCEGAALFFPLSEQLFENQTAMFDQMTKAGEALTSAVQSQPLEQRFVTLAQGSGLIDFVKQRGISETKAKQCLSNTDMVGKISKNVQDATAKYNISGTPTVLLNGAEIPDGGKWDNVKARLKAAGL
jgi:protein-disulfide isomerase